MRPLAGLVLCVQLISCATASAAEAARKPPAQSGPAHLNVDLREAPRHLVHVRISLAAQPGPMALVYPKWIPGEHGPTGPITDVASLQLHAGDRSIGWRRDDVDMYKIHFEVPRGSSELQVSFDFISPPPSEGGFSSGSSMTTELALVSWNQLLMVPDGTAPREFLIEPSLQLPAGWKEATALDETSREGDLLQFKPVSMEQLIDSPVLAGAHLSLTPIGENHGAKVLVAIAAETEPETKPTPAMVTAMQHLVAEEVALFGARHFDHYTFLITLSDRVAHFGLEHHQSSDDRLAGRTLLDPELSLSELGSLLAHESTHSWNGKYRRPAGLATPDYQTPMKGDLLWVYEGLTEYLGKILPLRAGFYDAATGRDDFAAAANSMRQSRGRLLRPLADTTVAAQILYPSRDDWSALRRSVDFYLEGQLLWLEADMRIREKTGGKRSLDDFCRAFFGGESTGPQVNPYTLANVVSTLHSVSPDDWDAFFEKRVQETSDDAPMGGLNRAGWKLGSTDEPGLLWKSSEKVRKHYDLRPSIGVVLDAETGVIVDVIPGSAADKAGISPAMKIIAVNGHKFSNEGLATVIEANKGTTGPMVLLTENSDSYASYSLDYHGGLAYPHLDRIEGTPDTLTAIFAPTVK